MPFRATNPRSQGRFAMAGNLPDKALRLTARIMAKSTAIVGYRGVGRLFRPLSQIGRLRCVEAVQPLGSNRHITFPAFDYYWGPFLWTGRPYEEDVEAIFRRLAPLQHKLLIDCGANIGYWTVKLSDPRYGFDRIIAIEPNSFVYGYLKRNAAAVGGNVTAMKKAIGGRDGETVLIDETAGHAVGMVGDVGVPVETVSIGSLLAARRSSSRGTVIVKLDVEGGEIDAIRGAEGEHGFDLLFIFEDWPRSGMTVTGYVIGVGYLVFGMNREGRVQALTSVAEAIAFNAANSVGYQPSNLIATRQPDRFLPILNGTGTGRSVHA